MLLTVIAAILYFIGFVAGTRLYYNRHEWRLNFYGDRLQLSLRERQAASLAMGAVWPLVLAHHAMFVKTEASYFRNLRLEREAEEREARITALEREAGILPKSDHPMDIARWNKEGSVHNVWKVY